MSITDLLFPRRCLGCGQIGAYFCAACVNKISLCSETICPMCGQYSPAGLTHPHCQKKWGIDGLTAIFAYRGLAKKAIKKLKYRFVSDLAGELVELFLSFAGEEKELVKFCRQPKVTLVPIPLHPARKRWRGFNQSELLGKQIAGNFGLDFAPNLLSRTKVTKPQADLGKQDRQANIKGAFALAPNIVISLSRYIVLFDDIWTSGATLREATSVLKKAGAKSVWGVTLAR